ncbi:MAG: peptidylprolyl isomerase [Brevundimonas sp.]|jgi:peptidylprolyl isomerase|uniref:peptidylprolyl isomerase n=2 Tax=Brevundimonas sp. TaxID=1871086 RepID=UPI0022C3FD8B|nr:peptidylprolyl isomerase [Brevundimonas sp.]MCZ8087266.1 peptidylprolyl isomerase [Brevundimonas sp.]MCZ8193896.1 peptidylprolyl isomerase [Brevundimonas sp.]
MAAAATSLAAGGAMAQDAWRALAPENVWVLDTSKGRVVVALAPEVAPRHVERIRTLTARGFYDGLGFHRVIPGFMAQGGDPEGTGAGGSDLPDVPGEFSFRRGREAGFTPMEPRPGQPLSGIVGVMPVVTQPDAQMMVTADFRVPATARFCPGVLGMARSTDPNSANSQFFLMTAANPGLDGDYTALGRVVQGLEVVNALKPGDPAEDGAVTADPDRIVRARMASDLPAVERPILRIAAPGTPALVAAVAATRDVCSVIVPVEISGGPQ